MLAQKASLLELHREVQPRLSSERREHAVRLLFENQLLNHLDGQGLDINFIRDILIRHDRRRVRVQQDDFDPLFLQWTGNDVEGAKALLDEAGLVDTDGDGWREYNGEKISLNAVCPNGWTDWQASMELVAAAGQAIGVEITTYYPEADSYNTVFTDPDQTEYAIFMWSPDASTPSNPWTRINQFMGMDYVGVTNNWSGNWGQYKNEEADALIKQIPLTTDEAELKNLYTELTKIYLTEVPSFSLMYRPSVFHAVNESVWTNYPYEGSTYTMADGTEVLVPPADCTDGFGIAALYNLELVG